MTKVSNRLPTLAAQINSEHEAAGNAIKAGIAHAHEDHRRKPNGTLYEIAADAALAHSVSWKWKGYWQR